jgi:hypothetical protein
VIALAQTGHDLIAWGDHAIVEGETIRAWAGHQLLGTYSRYGWHHPGPALFYWMAPWHELFGRSPAALNASVAFLNAVMVAAVVAVTGRRAGRVAALWAAALAGLYIVQQGPTLVRDFWVPHAVVFPFAALIVLTAAAATGSVELLPLVALIASFLASTDVSVAPATAVVVTAGVAVFVALRSWRTLHRPRRRWLAIGAATLLATALVWYPPVYQQLKPGPGNLNTLRKFFGQSAPGHTLREGIDAVSNSFSVLVGGGRHELDAVPASTGAHVFLLLTLVLLVAGIVVGWRRQRMFAMALCVTALAALLAEIYAVTAIRGEVFTYLVDWSGAAAIAAWLGIGCDWSRRRAGRHLGCRGPGGPCEPYPRPRLRQQGREAGGTGRAPLGRRAPCEGPGAVSDEPRPVADRRRRLRRSTPAWREGGDRSGLAVGVRRAERADGARGRLHPVSRQHPAEAAAGPRDSENRGPPARDRRLRGAAGAAPLNDLGEDPGHSLRIAAIRELDLDPCRGLGGTWPQVGRHRGA